MSIVDVTLTQFSLSCWPILRLSTGNCSKEMASIILMCMYLQSPTCDQNFDEFDAKHWVEINLLKSNCVNPDK